MDDSTLKSLSITTASVKLKLQPEFHRKGKSYFVVVESTVESVTIKATPSEADAFVQTQGAGKDGSSPLSFGENTLTVRCEAADKSFSLITIVLFRPTSAEVGLQEIKGIPNGLLLVPPFSKFETSYSIEVDGAVAADALKSLRVVPLNTKASMTALSPTDLHVGDTIYEFKVTSEDGQKSETYRITLRKSSLGPRPTVTEKDDLLCSLCKTLLKHPREPNVLSCKHSFCLDCLQSFATTSLSEGDTHWECPLHDDKLSFSTVNPLNLSNQAIEKILGELLCKCPFEGCSKSDIKYADFLKHINECSFSTGNTVCSECNQLMQGDGPKHTNACTFNCPTCSKKVANNGRATHKAICNRTNTEPSNPSSLQFEKDQASKKAPYSSEKVNQLVKEGMEIFGKTLEIIKREKGKSHSRPDFQCLVTAKELFCQGIIQSVEQATLKKCIADEKLVLQVGKTLDLLRLSYNFFPITVTNDSLQNQNSNDAAKDEFWADEVKGLLLQLGVAPSASNEAQLKAMEAEYHSLKSSGKSNEAEEVKGLLDWKMKQIRSSSAQGGDSAQGNAAPTESLELIIQKFKDATIMAPMSSDCYEELLISLLEDGRFQDALKEAERALSIHPTKSQIARVAFAISFLSVNNFGKECDVEVVSECLSVLEHVWMQLKMAGPTLTNSGVLFGFKKHLFTFLIFESLEFAYSMTFKYEKALDLCKDLLFALPKILQQYQKQSKSFRDTSAMLLKAQTKACLVRQVYQNEKFEAFTNGLNATVVRNSTMLREIAVIDASESLESTILNSLGVILILEPSPYTAFQIAQFKSCSSSLTNLLLSETILRACLSASANDKLISLLEKEAFYKEAEKIAKSYKKAPTVAAAKGSTADGKKKPAAVPPPVKGKNPNPAPAKADAKLQKSAPSKNAPAIKSAATSKTEMSPGKKSKADAKVPPPSTGTKSLVSPAATAVTAEATAAFSPSPSSDPEQYLWPGGRYKLQYALSQTLVNLISLNNSEPYRKDEMEKELLLLFKDLVEQKPGDLEVVTDYGNLLLEQKKVKEAIQVFTAFPFSTGKPSYDELFLHSEIARLLMKEKDYKHPKLKTALISLGQNYGIKSISTYADTLDALGSESALLKEVFAGSNRKSVDDPDMISFFKSKYWM